MTAEQERERNLVALFRQLEQAFHYAVARGECPEPDPNTAFLQKAKQT